MHVQRLMRFDLVMPPEPGIDGDLRLSYTSTKSIIRISWVDGWLNFYCICALGDTRDSFAPIVYCDL